jgi:hypothetical protein
MRSFITCTLRQVQTVVCQSLRKEVTMCFLFVKLKLFSPLFEHHCHHFLHLGNHIRLSYSISIDLYGHIIPVLFLLTHV